MGSWLNGRAPALQAGGCGFDSRRVHFRFVVDKTRVRLRERKSKTRQGCVRIKCPIRIPGRLLGSLASSSSEAPACRNTKDGHIAVRKTFQEELHSRICSLNYLPRRPAQDRIYVRDGLAPHAGPLNAVPRGSISPPPRMRNSIAMMAKAIIPPTTWKIAL